MTIGIERRVAVHAALADPVRLQIVDELALSDRSPTELGARFAVRSNLLAHHLDVLHAAGVIERVVSQGDRRRRYVRLVLQSLASTSVTPAVCASGVVFVCTRNSARSQLAAALWNASSTVRATSAGTDPADRVHPEAIRSARRRRLDLTDAAPSRLDLGQLEDRLLVTVCDRAHEELGELMALERTAQRALHWSVPDPAETGSRDEFDSVVGILERRVHALARAVSAP